MGGRPTTGPMQAAGGSRGALVYSSYELDDDISFASSINDTAEALLPQNRNDTGAYISYSGFNLRDQVRLGDPVPLQFKYKAADCRIYYTLANAYNMSTLWRDVGRAGWDDPSLCVADSTGYPTANNNTSSGSSKQAPVPTAQIPSLDLTYSEHVDFAVEDTGGLPDARVAPSRNLQIGPCNSNGGCNDGVSVCQPILVTCQTGVKQSVSACLPPCQNRDGSDSCGSPNSFCNLVNKQESKLNTVQGKGKVTFGNTLRTGFCVPRSGTPALECPA